LTAQETLKPNPAEDSLQIQGEFNKIIAAISIRFINLPAGEITDGVNFALSTVGTPAKADRCSIYLFSNKNDTGINFYQWCAPGISPSPRDKTSIATGSLPWMTDALGLTGAVYVLTDGNLPAKAEAERQWLQAQDIQSMLAVPLISNNLLIGFLGFDTINQVQTWPHEFESLLLLVGEIFVNAFERNKIEETLRQSEARFRRVTTSISDHIYSTEISQDGHPINQYISPNVVDLTGYPMENFITDWNFWPKKVIHPEDQPAAARQAAQLVRGQNSEIEYRLVRADGETIWVRDSGRSENTGQSIVVYGVVSDITGRKQVEAALVRERALLAQRVQERTAELSQANAELARAARLKDEFLAAMSHELRTPLNAVLGMTEALQEQVYGPLNNKQATALHQVEKSGHHLLSLINDILDLSRIEAGKLELQIAPVDVDSMCQASFYLMAENARKKQIKVHSRIETGIIFQADERRVKQALTNLLNNAIKFTPNGGDIGLEVISDTDRQSIDFTVWDTGIGIAGEDMNRLFKPFVQLDSRLARQYEGTGLGLILVYRIVEMHQGSVSVESTVGEGSRFTISLPFYSTGNQLPQDSQSHIPADIPAETSPLILLVEDNESNIVTISDYLRAKNYRVSIARDGVEALERVKEAPPDLILMDIQMSVMDGLEATRHIRANESKRIKDIPIIALTALAMPGDRERCLEAGANEYISKPVQLRQLLEIIKTFPD